MRRRPTSTCMSPRCRHMPTGCASSAARPSKVIEWPWTEFTVVSSEPRAAWAQKAPRQARRCVPWARHSTMFRRTLNRQAFLRAMPTKAEIDALLDRYLIDVAHFTYPVKWPTRRPYIFEPHDIQQFHFPEFFPDRCAAVAAGAPIPTVSAIRLSSCAGPGGRSGTS